MGGGWAMKKIMSKKADDIWARSVAVSQLPYVSAYQGSPGLRM